MKKRICWRLSIIELKNARWNIEIRIVVGWDICIYTNTLYITIIVVFLTAFSTRVSLLSSKTHNGDYTPKNLQNSNYIFPRKFVSKTNSLCNISHNNIKNISLNKIVLTILKHLLVSEATIRCNLQPQCFNRITAVSTYGHIAVSLHLETRDGYHARSSNTVILMNASDEDE